MPRQAVEALGDDRRGDVVREVRDELRRRRVEAGEIEPQRIAPVERHVRGGGDVAEVRFEPLVELDGVNVRALIRQDAGEGAEARGRSRARRRRM
jgi:hypothetical protein